MNILIMVASARRGHTMQTAETLQQALCRLDPSITAEIVRLSEYSLHPCQGCQVCFTSGEEHCPLQDDRDLLLDKISAADGVVFATPNYAFHESALLKIFLERIAYILHRPRFFGKFSTALVCQGIYGGGKVLSYLHFVTNALGFNRVKGAVLQTLEPMRAKTAAKNRTAVERVARRMVRRFRRPRYPVPSLFELAVFRFSRSRIRVMLDSGFRDYTWFQEQGWFDSGFYYPVRIGVFKRIAGKFFDLLAKKTAPEAERSRSEDSLS